jgi:hypothetical protein
MIVCVLSNDYLIMEVVRGGENGNRNHETSAELPNEREGRNLADPDR